MNVVDTKRTPWNDEGFASKPKEMTSSGGEIIYRAFGGTSGVLGNCFFTPAVSPKQICHWTAEFLEIELNAALWGNDFEGLTKFEIKPNVKYHIGKIAHDNYAGWEGSIDKTFTQRSFITPSGIFKQVKIILEQGIGLRECVKQSGGSFKIAAGNFSRAGAKRSRANAKNQIWN
jgi:hypothetical protein